MTGLVWHERMMWHDTGASADINLDPGKIAAAITPHTAIMPVHV